MVGSLYAQVWELPPERMKAAREHRVPLCERSFAILEQMKEHRRTHLRPIVVRREHAHPVLQPGEEADLMHATRRPRRSAGLSLTPGENARDVSDSAPVTRVQARLNVASATRSAFFAGLWFWICSSFLG